MVQLVGITLLCSSRTYVCDGDGDGDGEAVTVDVTVDVTVNVAEGDREGVGSHLQSHTKQLYSQIWALRHSFNTLRVNLSRRAGTPYLSPTPLPLVSSCFGLKDCNDTRATCNVSVDARSNGEGVPMQNDLKVHLCCYAHHSHAPYTLSCIEDST